MGDLAGPPPAKGCIVSCHSPADSCPAWPSSWVGLAAAATLAQGPNRATPAPSERPLRGPVPLPPGLVRDGVPTDGALLHLVSYERGRRLFSEETFGGNGRTCATCHEPRDEFGLSPELVQARFAVDPTDPLFRPIDSDLGDGASYSLLLTFALFRVDVPLHPDVRLADDPGARVVALRRSVPSIVNVALTAPYQWDGRAGDLLEQALGAVHDHFEATRLPSRAELLSLARFQSEVIAPPRLRALLATGDPIPLEEEYSIPLQSLAARRGQAHFQDTCGTCHTTELLHRPPSDEPGIFRRAFISELNKPGLPVRRFLFRNPDGTETAVDSPDPGLALLTGRAPDVGFFEVPSLRGIRHTAPYFHDNSLNTLQEVVDHYNGNFGFGLTGRRLEELIAFLETL